MADANAPREGPRLTLTEPSEGRRRNMRAIRRTNTKPELALRSALHRLGYRFRKDLVVQVGNQRPRPDIAFTRQKIAVFVDGCFWHCCPEHGRPPTTNTAYWGPKLQRNVIRDLAQRQALESAGWTVLQIWEHESLAEATATIEAAVAAID